MASRMTYPETAFEKKTIVIDFGFAPNGTSAGTILNNQQAVASVTRTGTGAYTITLTDTYPRFVSLQAAVQLHAVADTQIVFGDVNSQATGGATIKFTILTAGSAADISANANNNIWFTIKAQNSSVKP